MPSPEPAVTPWPLMTPDPTVTPSPLPMPAVTWTPAPAAPSRAANQRLFENEKAGWARSPAEPAIWPANQLVRSGRTRGFRFKINAYLKPSVGKPRVRPDRFSGGPSVRSGLGGAFCVGWGGGRTDHLAIGKVGPGALRRHLAGVHHLLRACRGAPRSQPISQSARPLVSGNVF